MYADVDPLIHKPRYLRETAESLGEAEVALTRPQSQVDEERRPKTNITVGQALDQMVGRLEARGHEAGSRNARAVLRTCNAAAAYATAVPAAGTSAVR